ncbi:MAG: hypothetical protein CBD39_03180 [Flavobacteriaceae bacterium TMED179]|nr:MAG: hypothetical protein CBD39_03180 [Flavobacteriaceae bacterium TMED179]|tara:strand:- start:478 stop:1092 length:615 start_codon:yes stop_codon:yes gene_type:complete
MDRRKALKNIGTGIGTFTVSPSIISLFNSCQQDTIQDIVTFSNEQYDFITKLMDIIIPKTDTPGAIELNLNKFIDIYINEVWPSEIKMVFLLGLDKCLITHSKSGIEELKLLLDKTFKIDKEISDKYDDLISDYQEQIELGYKASIDKDILEYLFLKKLRDMTIMSFKINEYVAKNLLAYSPIPGDYKGCVDLQETTGGKLWSL